jgi:phage baseplate assembly protein W|tara:strand:- start:268 stop:729 length:462 start_codon:yes stop_codon:yes gene_type:complete
MPNQRYGITFPFTESSEGFFLGLNKTPDSEVRSNLIHLILTLKGTRYFLPDFGTNLMRYIFEPMDAATKTSIDTEIREAVDKFIPNLTITKVEVMTAEDVRQQEKEEINTPDVEDNSFTFVGATEREYSIRVRIDFTAGDNVFQTKDFVIINL